MTDITELAQEARINAGCGEYLSPAETMELVEALEKAQQRIADLESRTVKIPYLPDDCDRIEAHFKYQVAINAAGIKVEAE
ncbi:hypothetical protein ACB381_20680 [Klebsiella michiganensis]|uniref:hypothetical protein n=1 Tax=Klebsiella michiganensis TaxID=1134687 RepID=UPI00244B0F33|nr:hypothetical protein [Klebsiella michiganensis]EKV4193281.1 hypothetical protein [Klebsiella michiganensis]MDH0490746.1 hypothetical protein [Klebsiella michiganensis]HDT0616327.1 hypothetical protein [Klebsiella michiganensis]HDZ2433218.1 hypothetical protein [Klebsiella pneumoniae]